MAALISLSTVIAAEPELNLVPWPQSVERQAGALTLGKGFRIVYSDDRLKPVAEILSEDIFRCFGLRPAVTADKAPDAGDVFLSFSERELADEEYVLTVSDSARVEGSTYRGVAHGAVTLLQAVNTQGRELHLPHVKIQDKPQFPFRAVQIDLYQRKFPVQVLYEIVELARLYRMSHVYYHDLVAIDFLDADTISDTERQKRLVARSRHKHITLEQLRDLVEFARRRGVRIVPNDNIEWMSGLPADTKPVGEHVQVRGTEAFFTQKDRVFAKIAEVFPDSEYIHCGALAGEAVWGGEPEEQALLKKHGLRNGNDGFIYLANGLSELARKHGKHIMIWEGIENLDEKTAPVTLSKDVTFCVYSTVAYNPELALRYGYRFINCAWDPLYIVQAHLFAPLPERIYAWHAGQARYHRSSQAPYEIDGKHPLIEGAMLCFWEDTHEAFLPILRTRVPAVAERSWNPNAGKSFDDFREQQAAADDKVRRILFPVRLDVERLTDPVTPEFTDRIAIHMKATAPGTIRYRLDRDWDDWVGEERPASEGRVYGEPITTNGDVTVLAQLYDEQGEPVGYPTQQKYMKIDPVYRYVCYGGSPDGGWTEMPDFAKLPVLREGVIGRMTDARYTELNRFIFAKNERLGNVQASPQSLWNPHAARMTGQLRIPERGAYRVGIRHRDGLATLTLSGKLAAKRLRLGAHPLTYWEGTLDAGVYPFEIQSFYRAIQNDLGIVYRGPGMKNDRPLEELMLSIRDHQPAAALKQARTEFVNTQLRRAQNLALGKPVQAPSHQDRHVPRQIVDGIADNSSGWHAERPQAITVDLEALYALVTIRLYPYFDGRRYYQYTVDVSSDGRTWQTVVDQSKNTTPSTPAGRTFKPDDAVARYVRVNMLKNSVNPGVHLNELMVYGFRVDPDKPLRTLTGTVRHGASGKPVRGIDLLFDAVRPDPDGAPHYERIGSLLTDEAGAFTFRTTEKGPFRITSGYNQGTFLEGEMIWIHEIVSDFEKTRRIEIVSDIGRAKIE